MSAPRRWLGAHRRAAADALTRLTAGGNLMTVVALAVVLVLPALGYWLVDNAERAAGHLASPGEVSLWLADDAREADQRAIERRLAEAGVARWRYVSKEEALAGLQAISGLGEVAAGLKRNPLPDAFIVVPQAGDAAGLAAFAEAARGWPKVAEVHADLDWARRLGALLTVARTTLRLAALLLAVALVAVVFNTIRLQIAGRQAEIELALLIGATPAWTARPFLWLGALEGLLAGALAVLALLAIHRLAAPTIAELAGLFGDSLRLAPPTAELALAVLAGALAIGWLGALLSVRLAHRG
jgi:cell division transport system permease protein